MIYSYNNKRMRWRWRYRNRAYLCLVGMRWNIATLFERSKTSSKQIQRAPGLLIGNDNIKALEPEEIRRAEKGGPYAVRTQFGWALNGPLGRHHSSDARRSSNFIKTNVGLTEQFERFCNREFNDSIDEGKLQLSQDDHKAYSIMKETSRLNDGHYDIALPWRKEEPCLPDNKLLARHRLNVLKKKLTKTQELCQKYSEFIGNLLSMGYAEMVPKEERDRSDGHVWYLPHHPVFHPTKGKLRVVFDCSAKYRDISLNSQLLTGPNLTNTLVGVLMRFRQDPVAIMHERYRGHVPPGSRRM